MKSRMKNTPLPMNTAASNNLFNVATVYIFLDLCPY